MSEPNWEEVFDEPVLTAERLGGGFANDVWSVRTDAGEFVVKITRNPPRPNRPFWDGLEMLFGLNTHENMRRLPGLADLMRDLSPLSVPRIVHVDRRGREIPEPYIVAERLPGDPLTLDGENRENLARELGQHVGALHRKAFSDWGRFGEARYEAAEWPPRLAATLEFMVDKWYEDDAGVRTTLDSFLEQARALDAPSEFCLILPDFRLAQFLQRDGHVSAVVDVESYVIGPPALDLIVLEHSLPADLAPAFSEGYEEHSSPPRLALVRSLYRYLYCLVQALGEYDFEEWMNRPAIFE